ncbi:hypothetical protein ACP4OV_009248 [Aristida adscensionis]
MLWEAWSATRGWLTPPVLFVLINAVVGTIVVASRMMAAEVGGGDRLARAPSAAFDRLRCFSFSRIGLDAAAGPDGDGERLRGGLLRAPSSAFDRLRCLSFSRPGHHAPAPPPFDDGAAAADKEVAPSPPPEPEVEREDAPRVERSRSEAAAEAPARRRPRARRARKAAATTSEEEEPDTRREFPAAAAAAVEVDVQADDFIRRFREQLRLQRLDSILRHRDTLRRTGTA